MKIRLNRKNEAFHFEATGDSGIVVNIDGATKIGGNDLGARPMELLLMGLGGCSSIDIGLILKKQRQTIKDFKIEIDAQRSGDVPSLFTDIVVTFRLYGDLDADKVRRAVNLSMDKYCSVHKIIEATASISSLVYINDEQLLSIDE